MVATKKNHVTLRIPNITEKQIAELADRWGENRSQVIIRSIDRTWMYGASLVEQSDPLEENEEQVIQVKPVDVEPYYHNSTETVTLYLGDAENVLATLEGESVDCIVTSPPYYGQRDYEVNGQIGLESHPQLYINKLIMVFREARRVLKPMGSLWVNIGDTYWSGKGKAHGVDSKQKHRRFNRPQDKTSVGPWCTPKQKLLIPHRFAVAMQDDGWIVRNDNVWYKPNPTPDPVKDRCARAHEYVFHFVKQRRYWFDTDAVAIPSNGNGKTQPPHSVWIIKLSASGKEHKAAFYADLVALPIRATCPPKGVLLDPFCGSGTSLHFVINLGDERKAIGIDLSEDALQEAQLLLDTGVGNKQT